VTKLVIIGNGPSLKGFEFRDLINVDTVGMNAAYRYWDQIDWYPTFYVCMDDKVTYTHHKNIKKLIDVGRIKKFFLTRFMLDFYPELITDSRIYFLEQFNEKHRELAIKYGLNSIDNMFFKSSSPNKFTTGSHAVRFGCYLGYKEIVIIGVDLEYKPAKEGIVNDSGIELRVTKKIDDNPNYFFDGYQDVGDVFNIPNPAHLGDLHLDVFAILARDAKQYLWPVTINNANKKSKLHTNNIFGYIELNDFVSFDRKNIAFQTSKNIEKNISDFKVLIIDPTHIGHQSATGQIKSLFFSEIEEANIAQICVKFDDSSISGAIGGRKIRSNDFKTFCDLDEVVEFARAFSPDAVYCRPIDSKKLFEAVFAIKERLRVPLLTHFMDDWVLRYQGDKYSSFKAWEQNILKLVRLSDIKIAISKKMADSYTFRYGGVWQVLANGTSQTNKQILQCKERNEKFVIRYMGGAADDMNFQSLLDFAYAIESDNYLNANIIFEIYTMPWYLEKLKLRIGNFSSCSVQTLVAESKYYKILNTSSCLLIAYNFDVVTEKYVSLSMANKMPECLASGVPVIAFGPSSIATIGYLENNGLAVVINKRLTHLIKSKLHEILVNPPHVQTIAARAHHFALNSLNSRDTIDSINKLLLTSIEKSDLKDEFLGYTNEIINFENILLNEELTLGYANECFQSGLYLKALFIYFRILPNLDFMQDSVFFNIYFCLKRLGFKNLDPCVIKSRFS
jgi:hypothetical protein